MIWIVAGSCIGFAVVLLGLGVHAYRPPGTRRERRRTWRLIIPREARFSVAASSAWFAALAPRLTDIGPAPVVELYGEDRTVGMRLTAPASWEAALRAQSAAWFPGARLEPVEATEPAGPLAIVPLRLEKPDLYPLRLPQAKEPDPLLGLFGVLTERAGRCGVRIAWGPAPADWRLRAPAALHALERGQRLPPRGAWLWLWRMSQLIRQAGTTSAPGPHQRATPTPTLAGATAKAHDPVFGVSVTVWAQGPSRTDATARVRALAETLCVSFRYPSGNALVPAAREPLPSWAALERKPRWQVVLSAAELAALFHLPTSDPPFIPCEMSRQAAPATHLVARLIQSQEPTTWLGEALTSEGPFPFGLGLPERRLHTYVVGKTGTGKSTLLATIARQDLAAGRGAGLIDPHGELAERVLALVPAGRQDEVCYFNPADADYPIGLNLLAATTPTERPFVASGVVGVFKKLYATSWGPRTEYFLRNTVLALLATPSPSLLLLPRFLTDRGFRQHLLQYVRDPVLRSFFVDEFEQYDARWRAEAISPILNKVNQFLASPVVRHVVGQRERGLKLREVMDQQGIFIANLATGKIGEDNAALLGGLLVAGFQLAAMARADQPEAERRDFFLSVDEFQLVANDAFATILSEARKYRLSLTLSHQYLNQLSPPMSDAVLGNVGSLAVFRIGAPDTVRLVRELAPVFDSQDLAHLPDHHFAVRINHAGEAMAAFSARTIPLPSTGCNIGSLIQRSRQRWARPRAEVELEIADLWEGRVD
jgi:hypothetical protein